MIVWFPLLKFVVSVVLLYLAFMPILKHMRAYTEALKGNAIMDPRDTYLPREGSKYLPLAIAILLIVMTPFRLQSPQQLERSVQTYDVPISAPAEIQRKARSEYRPSSNEESIQRILEKDSKQ